MASIHHGLVLTVPSRPSVPSPVCHAPHPSLLPLIHLLLSFTLQGPCGKLRFNVEADILRLGESMWKGMKAESIMPCVSVYTHTYVFVVQVRKRKNRALRSEGWTV